MSGMRHYAMLGRTLSKETFLRPVCTENLIRVDDAPESPKLAE